MADELSTVDLTDLDNFAQGFPHHLFEIHRREAPVWWHEPTAHTPDDEGFWSVATYDEVLRVLSDPSTFSSETGGDRPYGGTTLQDLPVAGVMLNRWTTPGTPGFAASSQEGSPRPPFANSRASCA